MCSSSLLTILHPKIIRSQAGPVIWHPPDIVILTHPDHHVWADPGIQVIAGGIVAKPADIVREEFLEYDPPVFNVLLITFCNHGGILAHEFPVDGIILQVLWPFGTTYLDVAFTCPVRTDDLYGDLVMRPDALGPDHQGAVQVMPGCIAALGVKSTM